MEEDVEFEKRAKRKIRGIDRSYQSKIFKNTRKKNHGICHLIVSDYDERKVVQAAFLTVGCQMKKNGSCWNCNYGALGECFISEKEYIKAFRERLSSISGDTLVLEGFGSITDDKEFNQETFKKIFEIAVNEGRFEAIVIETHVTQISEELVRDLEKLNSGKKRVFFEIGVEDMNPEHRKLINKLGVENGRIEEVYHLLEEHGMHLEINLIYGFPFMTEEERIEAVHDSLRTIKNTMPNADGTLFLMSVKENTILNYMYRKGVYKKPDPWGFVELIKRITEDEELEDCEPPSFAWFGEKENEFIEEEKCYACPECKEKIVSALRRINGTFINDERKKILAELFNSCNDGCYEKFLRNVDLEKDGKKPEERYRDFLKQILKDDEEYEL